MSINANDHDKRKKQCNKIVKKFNKSQAATVIESINELKSFIPDFSRFIISQIYNKLVNFLSTGNIPLSTLDSLFNLVLDMLKKVESAPETDPYDSLINNSEFLTSLFMHAGLNEKKEFNQPVIDIIMKFLVKKPGAILNFLLNSKESAHNLMNALAEKNNHEAGMLFKQLFFFNSQITELLINDVIDLIHRLPPYLVIDLMIGSEKIKATMPQDEFVKWIFDQETLSLSDVRHIFDLYPLLWGTTSSMSLILKTDPPTKLAFTNWIHDKTEDCFKDELPEDLTEEVVGQILDPKYKFSFVDDKKQQINTKNLFLYSRLFVLSYSNPDHVVDELKTMLYDLVVDEDEYVATGATQVLILWILNYNFQTKYQISYKIAEEIYDDTNRMKAHRILYKILLHFLGTQHEVAEMILRSDPKLRLNQDEFKLVIQEQWEFPNFTFIEGSIPLYDQHSKENMLEMLDDITQFLGYQPEQNEEKSE